MAKRNILSTDLDKLANVLGDESRSKSKTFFQQATDTFRELALIFLTMIVLGGALYALFEHASFLKGIWWAFVTAFTVGYGDVVPHSVAGRVVAAALMTVSVFVIIPLVTALMAKRMIVDNDAWTNEEQMYVLGTAERMNAYLDRQEQAKQVKSTVNATGTTKSKAKTVDSGKAKLTRNKK